MHIVPMYYKSRLPTYYKSKLYMHRLPTYYKSRLPTYYKSITQTDQWKFSISLQNNDSYILTTKWGEDEHSNQRWHLPQHKTKKEIIIKDVNVLLSIPVNLYYQFNDLIK